MTSLHANYEQGVFTYLIEKLGVKDVQFSELITLEPEELRQLGDIYGVIFLFKYPTGETRSDTPKDGTYDHEAVNNMFFANQTIQNACGTQALLSVLLNKDKESGGEVDIGGTLREFKGFTEGFPPDVRADFVWGEYQWGMKLTARQLRGETLSNSDIIRDVHNSFARSSPFIDETQRTATEDDDVYHFIAYVQHLPLQEKSIANFHTATHPSTASSTSSTASSPPRYPTATAQSPSSPTKSYRSSSAASVDTPPRRSASTCWHVCGICGSGRGSLEIGTHWRLRSTSGRNGCGRMLYGDIISWGLWASC